MSVYSRTQSASDTIFRAFSQRELDEFTRLLDSLDDVASAPASPRPVKPVRTVVDLAKEIAQARRADGEVSQKVTATTAPADGEVSQKVTAKTSVDRAPEAPQPRGNKPRKSRKSAINEARHYAEIEARRKVRLGALPLDIKGNNTSTSTSTSSPFTTNTSPSPSSPSTINTTNTSLTDDHDLLGERRRKAPSWKNLTDALRAQLFHEATVTAGGVAFDLNLSPDVVAQALADERGFTTHIRRRLDRALRTAFGSPVGFWLHSEASTTTNRLHIHGGAVVDHNDRGKLAAALRRAGGVWAHERGVRHQVTLKDDRPYAGFYAAKNPNHTRRVISDLAPLTGDSANLLTVTNDVRKIAQDLWTAERSALNSHY